MSLMRAKMQVIKVEKIGTQENITMRAVCKDNGYPSDGSDEDNTYALFTPFGECKLTINNPNLIGKIEEGQKYYIDFTVAQ